VNLYFSGRNIE